MYIVLWHPHSHAGCAMSGLIADSRTMVDRARVDAQNHWFVYNEPMSVQSVTQAVSNLAMKFGEDNDDDNEKAMVIWRVVCLFVDEPRYWMSIWWSFDDVYPIEGALSAYLVKSAEKRLFAYYGYSKNSVRDNSTKFKCLKILRYTVFNPPRVVHLEQLCWLVEWTMTGHSCEWQCK